MTETVQIPTVEEIYRIAYITNCGWVPGANDGWIHPNKKQFKYQPYEWDNEFVMVDDWPLEDAFWQAYEENNGGK